MRTQRGFTLFELLVAMALIVILSAVSVPVFIESNRRNSIWTGSELIGAAIRQTRLKAISQNTTYRVVFDCPGAGHLRGLVMTGDPDVDDAADRCSQTLEGDSGDIEMPIGVTYDTNDAIHLEVNSRGVYTASGAAIPLTISVSYGGQTRDLTVSTTGQITFSTVH